MEPKENPYKKICGNEYCCTEFVAKRKNQKYCCVKCKSQHNNDLATEIFESKISHGDFGMPLTAYKFKVDSYDEGRKFLTNRMILFKLFNSKTCTIGHNELIALGFSFDVCKVLTRDSSGSLSIPTYGSFGLVAEGNEKYTILHVLKTIK